MDNVVSKIFDSDLTLDQMLASLTARVQGIEWTIRESENEGRYIKGITSENVKIRVLFDDPKFSVEVYFPLREDATSVLENADKRAFMKRLDGHVLTAVKATNVKDD